MVSVASLLNPLPPSLENGRNSVVSEACDSSGKRDPSSSYSSRNCKMSKSSSALVKGKPKGKVNYKPCEVQDEATMAEHRRLQVNPVGHIGEYPRHIPYNSDKKSFHQRTGRDAFEAYQYTFRMPDEDPERDPHAMMWDYNVGLVRVTALFKSLKHSKTMPAKVMNANPGLREISHSITGGSIGAQGYWVPFEAAKAVAATFCHEIRYALTPVFGLEFPDLCTDPSDPAFLRLNIDPAIIRRCEEAAFVSRTESQEALASRSPRAATRAKGGPQWTPKSLRPKTTDTESGYGTDSERSAFGSPRSTGSNPWTPVNIPRSANWAHYQFPSPAKTPINSSPQPASKVSHSPVREAFSCKRDATDDGFLSDVSSLDVPVAPKRRRMSRTEAKKLTQEALAAKTLMDLHRADASLRQGERVLERRATS